MDRRINKLMIAVCIIQILSGISAIIIGILFYNGKLGDNVGICFIPVSLGMIFALVSMCIAVIRFKNESQ